MRVSSKLSFFIDRASRLSYDIHKKGIPNKSLQGLFIKFLRKNGEVKKFNQSNDKIYGNISINGIQSPVITRKLCLGTCSTVLRNFV